MNRFFYLPDGKGERFDPATDPILNSPELRDKFKILYPSWDAKSMTTRPSEREMRAVLKATDFALLEKYLITRAKFETLTEGAPVEVLQGLGDAAQLTLLTTSSPLLYAQTLSDMKFTFVLKSGVPPKNEVVNNDSLVKGLKGLNSVKIVQNTRSKDLYDKVTEVVRYIASEDPKGLRHTVIKAALYGSFVELASEKKSRERWNWDLLGDEQTCNALLSAMHPEDQQVIRDEYHTLAANVVMQISRAPKAYRTFLLGELEQACREMPYQVQGASQHAFYIACHLIDVMARDRQSEQYAFADHMLAARYFHQVLNGFNAAHIFASEFLDIPILNTAVFANTVKDVTARTTDFHVTAPFEVIIHRALPSLSGLKSYGFTFSTHEYDGKIIKTNQFALDVHERTKERWPPATRADFHRFARYVRQHLRILPTGDANNSCVCSPSELHGDADHVSITMDPLSDLPPKQVCNIEEIIHVVGNSRPNDQVYESTRFITFATITKSQLKAIVAISVNGTLGDTTDEIIALVNMVQGANDMMILHKLGVLTDLSYVELTDLKDYLRMSVSISVARRLFYLIDYTTGVNRRLVRYLGSITTRELLASISFMLAFTGVIQVIQGFGLN